MNSPTLIAALILMLCAPLTAQWHYGLPTQAAFQPPAVLDCPNLVSGDPGFGFTLTNGTGGADGLLGISLARGSLYVGTTEFLIDLSPTTTFAMQPFQLSGSSGVTGAGATFIPYPATHPP